MEFFKNAKAVRLRSHHDKFLLADDDEESVCQDRNGSSKNARWNVEFLDSFEGDSLIRLNSCYGKYLTASNVPLLFGVTGQRVLQTKPIRLDSSLEWEPIREGMQVKLKTRYGNFLRANGGVPPWRNQITHDVPMRNSHQDWILWDVEIIQIQQPTPKPSLPEHTLPSPSLSKIESSDSFVCTPPKDEGRTIYYRIADDNGIVDDGNEEVSFLFKGSSVEELAQKLEEETGIEEVIVCTRSPLNGNIYPLRLHLPPYNTTMHIVVVKAASKAARDFEKSGLL
ncbi:putative actin cross-linking protein [Thalictrum thalictroides]|uniref:Putative actin cross-linking protein n=1 Tax=Thalictrum thalictroides TaxID=46969 RepID=A0A7J6WD37_THATH|nr:putative actin cross-linking protein [Thalictrum thalictroides]